jgi:hypothetical protein
MDQVLRILNAPYPLEEDPKARLIVNLLISILVVATLSLLKPFGLESLPFQMAKQIPIFLGYGAISFFLLLMADYLIKPAFPVFYDGQFWTVKKNIIWMIFLVVFVSTGILFYSNAIGFIGVSGRSLLKFQSTVLAYASLPVLLFTLINWWLRLKRNVALADKINKDLHKPLVRKGTDYPLIFSSEFESDTLRIYPDQFLFAESADNFTDIVYTENGILKRFLIQATIDRFIETNSSEYVTRVNRSYLANLYKVESVNGNAQGYRLVFSDSEQTVPVSKQTSKVVHALLAKMHGSSV